MQKPEKIMKPEKEVKTARAQNQERKPPKEKRMELERMRNPVRVQNQERKPPKRIVSERTQKPEKKVKMGRV